MAVVVPKTPKIKGNQFPNTAAMVASLPFLRQNANDPPVLALGKSTILSGAIMAGTPLGPAGMVIGGAFGLISSVFGISARRRAEERARAEERRRYEAAQKRMKEAAIADRKRQVTGMRDQIATQRQERKTLLHKKLGSDIASIQSPSRVLSFQQTGNLDKISSSQFNAILAHETMMARHKIEGDIKVRDVLINELDAWDERLSDEDVNKGYKAVKDEGTLKKVKTKIEGLNN